MAKKFTQIPSDTFRKLQLNAGILVDSFTPETGTIGNIIGATTGGVSFSTNPEFEDFGEDIDNCPNNTMELKRLTSYDPQMSGNFLTLTAAFVKQLVGAADIDVGDSTHVIPRTDLNTADFKDVWWIGDYSEVNLDGTAGSAGYIAIHLKNSLNNAGFQIQSSKNAKGQMAFEFHGHYSIDNIDEAPFEIYVHGGSEAIIPSVTLNKHVINLVVGGATETLVANVIPSGTSVTWDEANDEVATVSNGTVTAVGAGNTIITASITKDGVTYNDTCTVIVTAASEP